jgi:hypothetical protein
VDAQARAEVVAVAVVVMHDAMCVSCISRHARRNECLRSRAWTAFGVPHQIGQPNRVLCQRAATTIRVIDKLNTRWNRRSDEAACATAAAASWLMSLSPSHLSPPPPSSAAADAVHVKPKLV